MGKQLRIYAFVESYPSVYKPYYDSQFDAFLRAGHTLKIFAVAPGAGPITPKARVLLPRIRYYYPDNLRSLPRFAPEIVATMLRSPGRRTRAAQRVARRHRSAKLKLKSVARMATLPLEAPDLCLVHSLPPMSWLRWLRDLYPGTPIGMYFHGGEPKGAGALSATDVHEAFGSADVVFTNTEFSRAQAVSRGCDPGKVVVVPVGFDLKDYQPELPRRYRAEGVLRLVSVGRLSGEKGIAYALQAIESLVRSGHCGLQYEIIGDGYLRGELEAFVREHGLSSLVSFMGTIPNYRVAEALGTADALLLPSIPEGTCAETQAAVVQEAMLMGTPVITTQTGGVPESIPAEMRPFSVKPKDAAALAEAIRRLAALPVHQLASLAASAMTWTREHYAVENLNARILDAMLAKQFPDPAPSAAAVCTLTL